MANHYSITKSVIGEAIQYPLKAWVRQNIETLPQGFDPYNQTTSQIRSRLKQLGWQQRSVANGVFLISPDENGNFEYSETLIDSIENEDYQEILENEYANEITFSLEKDLQSALRLNINCLGEDLIIIDNGKERHTIAGRIDITARNAKGDVVVIELKAIDAKSEVIAQTLAYMEAIKSEDNCNVKGIIVASGFSERVKLAARQIPSLRLVEYKFQFNFTDIN